MTREQAIEVLHNALYGGGNAFVMSEFRDAIKLALGALKQERVPEDVGTGTHHFLPSNLDEAAEDSWAVYEYRESPRGLYSTCYVDGFKAGAEWMARQGWIDDGSMPPETKQESDTLQGHREWTESKPVLAWDSMYGCCVDWTINGKWMSEQMGGYTGQVCHGIIAWRPIPEYKEKQ